MGNISMKYFPTYIGHLLESYSLILLLFKFTWPLLDLSEGDPKVPNTGPEPPHICSVSWVSSRLTLLKWERSSALPPSLCSQAGAPDCPGKSLLSWELEIPQAEPLHSLSWTAVQLPQASCLPLFPCFSKTLFLENFSFVTHVISCIPHWSNIGFILLPSPPCHSIPASLLAHPSAWQDSSECCHTSPQGPFSLSWFSIPWNTVDQWV